MAAINPKTISVGCNTVRAMFVELFVVETRIDHKSIANKATGIRSRRVASRRMTK